MKLQEQRIGAALLEANREAARQANNDIALYAGELSHHFLAGCFPSMMYVERSVEVAEPGLFDLSTEPVYLETRRMTARHWRYFDLSLLNEELLARRYVRELEYEFVLILDISRSLTGTWLAEAIPSGRWREHTCYRLKYLAYALLNSAIVQDFACRVVFLDQDRVIEYSGREDSAFPYAAIEQMDEIMAERPQPPQPLWMWDSVMRGLARSQGNLLVAVISDFLDPVQGQGTDEEMMLSSLSRLRYGKRLLVLQVNNPRDLNESNAGRESLFELTGGEQSDHRRFSQGETALRRHRYCNWLGWENGNQGRLESYLAASNVPYQKFFRPDDMNERLEELAYAVLQA